MTAAVRVRRAQDGHRDEALARVTAKMKRSPVTASRKFSRWSPGKIP